MNKIPKDEIYEIIRHEIEEYFEHNEDRLDIKIREITEDLASQLHRAFEKMKEIEQSIHQHAIGVQNVYNKFQELIDGSFIQHNQSKLEKMTYDLNDIKRDLKRDLKRDMDFVKKVYKTMPSMVKIKELDEESYERLMKVLELIG